MPSTYMAELALRSAVNTTQNSLIPHADMANLIKEKALRRSDELVTNTSTASSMLDDLKTNADAIGVAVQVIQIAFAATMHQLEVLKNHRVAFDKERQAGIATIVMPTNKEETDLSTEERVIKQYLALMDRNHTFSSYLGIHSAELSELQNAQYYSVLPFYRMSESMEEPVGSPKPLDRQRTAINLFFKSALPEALADIETDFQTEYKFIEFFRSTYHQENYLNNFRAPRFIMMSLANLLWNLQRPVDPISGFPLSVDQCILKCREVELLLNQLLNADDEPYLLELDNEENQLLSFVRKIEIHTKALRAAYVEEQLYQLNIKDVTNRAHEALRIMDSSIFELIYKRYNPVTGKESPDKKAAAELACDVSYLNQLLIRNFNLLVLFTPFANWVPQTGCINYPPATVMDALIIFCHLPSSERKILLANIEKTKIDSALEFAQTLRKFEKRFLQPIEAVAKKIKKVDFFDPKHKEVATFTACHLMPLVSLVVDDYRVDVDTEKSYQIAKQSRNTSTPRSTGKEQVQQLNKIAAVGKGYYQWALSPFIKLNHGSQIELDLLPKHQYRMTQMSYLLDSVSEIVLNYRSFLQMRPFQGFLLRCLQKVREEYRSLDQHIKLIDRSLASDEYMSRDMQSVLGPMMRDLNRSLDAYDSASRNFEQVISTPDFTEQQRQLLTEKLDGIHQQFGALFNEDSGINRMSRCPMQDSFSTPVQSTASSPHVESKQVIALRKVVQSCFDSLSYQSQAGHKGALITNLLDLIDRSPHFTNEQIKNIILELTHITASYRETWFFQAAYGQTRSAQMLATAIKDPHVNGILPLAAILFDNDVDYMKLSDEQVLQRLRGIREGHHWGESASDIELLATI